MKFTILSHAGMLVESNGVSLMTDPWLLGSCYWRSWWNYPKPSQIWRGRDLNFIYITHMHWDHFHGPSLRKLDPKATLLIPQAHFKRMREDALDFYQNIVELPHGKTVELAPGLKVTSYQFSLALDSVLVVDDGKSVLMDVNDCKIAGLPLRQVTRKHPKVDFVFRSHSSAGPYPYCIEAEDPAEGQHRTPEYYQEEFCSIAREVGARYAIPFASNHCFLHKDTYQYNSTAISPFDMQRYFEQHGPKESKCMVMIPGDSWSDGEGFKLQEHDFFTNRQKHLEEYAKEEAPVLEKYYRTEEAARIPFPVFQKYFQEFIDSLPFFIRAIFKPVIVFELDGMPDVHWVVDFKNGKVYESAARPDDYAFRITMHKAVLRDCIQKRMFATFTPSKRIAIWLRKGQVKPLMIYLQLIDMYEYEYFPIQRLLNRRFLTNWLRRWRELAQIAGAFVTVMLPRKDEDFVAAVSPRLTKKQSA